ncbi:MAG: hypothetical protein JWO48_1725 [Bryobacterales bacterium]|nr:hypothetical protein [Bryobacterales bacterium]
MISRVLRNTAKRCSYRMFRLGQRLGVDVLPRHFYSSIPDVRALSGSTYWRNPMDMVGIAGVDIPSQLAFVQSCCSTAIQESLKTLDLVSYGTRENGEVGYGPTETDFLYAFATAKRPRRIIQIGAGFSTAILLRAAADANYPVEITCIDPFPTEYLKRSHDAGKIKLVPEMAQTVDRNVLLSLGDGDMLFIDSTHTAKVGSEVNRLILDILPRLSTGTYVHFHDIYFPYDYTRSLFSDPFFAGESTLLHAFLINNDRYVIRCSLSMLHYAAPNELRALLPNYRPQKNNDGLQTDDVEGHFPSAIYLQVVG